MDSSRVLRLLVLALLATAGAIPAQSGAPTSGAGPLPVPLEKRGPPLGSVAPAFRLRDPLDREQTLETLSGRGGLVLLFVRSADW